MQIPCLLLKTCYIKHAGSWARDLAFLISALTEHFLLAFQESFKDFEQESDMGAFAFQMSHGAATWKVHSGRRGERKRYQLAGEELNRGLWCEMGGIMRVRKPCGGQIAGPDN